MNVKALFNKFSKFLKRLFAFVPNRLPIGTQEFNSWCADLFSTYPEFPDNDSTRGALAIMITQLKPQDAYKSKRYFGLSMRVAAAKEIAGNFYHEKKMEYKARAEAEAAAKKLAEVQTVADKPSSDNVVSLQK